MSLKTKDNCTIKPIGIGTFPLQGNEMSEITVKAIEAGYRLIDSSDDYRNEDAIGDGLKKSIAKGLVSRENVFLQAKVSDCDSYLDDFRQNAYFTRNTTWMKSVGTREIVRSKVFNSLKELKTDYIDSVLIHFAYPSFYEEIWEALIELKKDGYISYIGVSNFNIMELETLSRFQEKPQINEIYISPWGGKNELVDYCNINGIQLMTYSPLCVARNPKFNNKFIQKLMVKYSKSRVQIIIRWNIQRGSCPLPKTSNADRLAENINVFDFELTSEEMSLLNQLDFNHQYMPISKECPGI
jgi:diketogulonate reductase-like aldo/keto reductase